MEQPTSAPMTAIPPATAPIAGLNLDGVENGLGAYLKKKWWIVLLLVLAAVGSIWLSFYISIFIVVAGFVVLSKQYENSLFQAFAGSNHFDFVKHGSVTGQQGLIFTIGHSRSFSDIVAGTYQKWPFRLFLYAYTVGYGKSSQSYNRAVMSVNFQATLPAFVLRRHSLMQSLENEGESLRSSGYGQKMDLEGDFDKHFRVYIVAGTQVDVLSILAPDVMQVMLGLDKYEIEMTHQGTFYIYTHGYISKKQDLIDIYTILQAITRKIGTYADRQQMINSTPPPPPPAVALSPLPGMLPGS